MWELVGPPGTPLRYVVSSTLLWKLGTSHVSCKHDTLHPTGNLKIYREQRLRFLGYWEGTGTKKENYDGFFMEGLVGKWGQGRERVPTYLPDLFPGPPFPPIPVYYAFQSASYLVLAGESTTELLEAIGFGEERPARFH